MDTTNKPPPNIDSDWASVTDLFHRVNSVIPDAQKLVTIEPEMLVAEALDLLEEHGFSQAPVVVGREVLGLFSYQTFSRAVISHARAATKNRRLDPLELTVEECMDSRPKFARVTDEFVEWFDAIDRSDSVLVGSPDQLQGIVTAMDILRYLYRVASPFVLIGEVELALRALMQMAVDSETLAACAHECLKDKYDIERMPTELHAMTFNDYIQIVGDGRRWDHFQPFLGGNRVRTRAKLEQLRDVRNVIFHFRREITLVEYETLAANRGWMLRKVRTAEERQKEGQQ
ncbi:CBS domain-containing protein [Mariniblastus sp.]|nr:CBS domain-containing protein [Mariniblastus sp.]